MKAYSMILYHDVAISFSVLFSVRKDGEWTGVLGIVPSNPTT